VSAGTEGTRRAAANVDQPVATSADERAATSADESGATTPDEPVQANADAPEVATADERVAGNVDEPAQTKRGVDDPTKRAPDKWVGVADLRAMTPEEIQILSATGC
jgi:hypothetical protein